MTGSFYVVCSQRDAKPIMRRAYRNRSEADRGKETCRERDEAPEDMYWVAEIRRTALPNQVWKALGLEDEELRESHG